MIDADDVLLDDRPLVEFLGDVVAGRPDQFHPPLPGLMVGPGADEAGQEAVMDVDDARRVSSAQLRGQDLHVARQHHHVAAHFLEEASDLGEGRRSVVRGHRHVQERDAVPFDEAAQVFVIRDHARDLHVELAAVPARQEVIEAVFLA